MLDDAQFNNNIFENAMIGDIAHSNTTYLLN